MEIKDDLIKSIKIKDHLKKISFFSFVNIKNKPHLIKVGTYGNLSLSRNIIDNKYYLIKSIKKSSIINSSIDYIKHQFYIFFNIKCKYLLNLSSFIETDDEVFIIFKYFKGMSLLERLLLEEDDAFLRINTKITVQLVFTQILIGISSIHKQNAVHGSLSIENIYIDDDNHIKIVGMGDFPEKEDIFLDYQTKERLLYKTSTQKSDYFNMGGILYEMLHKHSPFIKTCQSDSLGQDEDEVEDIISNILNLKYKLNKEIEENCDDDNIKYLITYLLNQSETIISIDDLMNNQYIQSLLLVFLKNKVDKIKIIKENDYIHYFNVLSSEEDDSDFDIDEYNQNNNESKEILGKSNKSSSICLDVINESNSNHCYNENLLGACLSSGNSKQVRNTNSSSRPSKLGYLLSNLRITKFSIKREKNEKSNKNLSINNFDINNSVVVKNIDNRNAENLDEKNEKEKEKEEDKNGVIEELVDDDILCTSVNDKNKYEEGYINENSTFSIRKSVYKPNRISSNMKNQLNQLNQLNNKALSTLETNISTQNHRNTESGRESNLKSFLLESEISRKLKNITKSLDELEEVYGKGKMARKDYKTDELTEPKPIPYLKREERNIYILKKYQNNKISFEELSDCENKEKTGYIGDNNENNIGVFNSFLNMFKIFKCGDNLK